MPQIEIYATRSDENDVYSPPLIPREEYSTMGSEQFLIFARVYLKDKIMDKRARPANCWQHTISYETMAKMNNFFENIPDDIIDFSTTISRKLLLKYITSNMAYGFGIDLDEESRIEIYDMIHRLTEICPNLINREL